MPLDNLGDSFKEAHDLLGSFISDEKNISAVKEIIMDLVRAFDSGKKVMICGNGGSMTDAMHFAEELTGRFRSDRKALPAISISDPSFITCAANDFGFDEIFARGVEAYGNSGDVFIGLSTSGNSPNIIKAFEKAKMLRMNTVLLLGKDGGKLRSKAGHEIVINAKTSDRIQEIHMLILHIIVEGVEKIKFPDNYITEA
ncbi:MAG: SIS domain-containing protein [Candidatus Delongbacteria bacterium]|nr:SIS domain-containing protein [Candidatus Delongbacteria bacterium]